MGKGYDMIGESKAIQQVREIIDKVAATDATRTDHRVKRNR